MAAVCVSPQLTVRLTCRSTLSTPPPTSSPLTTSRWLGRPECSCQPQEVRPPSSAQRPEDASAHACALVAPSLLHPSLGTAPSLLHQAWKRPKPKPWPQAGSRRRACSAPKPVAGAGFADVKTVGMLANGYYSGRNSATVSWLTTRTTFSSSPAAPAAAERKQTTLTRVLTRCFSAPSACSPRASSRATTSRTSRTPSPSPLKIWFPFRLALLVMRKSRSATSLCMPSLSTFLLAWPVHMH